MRNKSDLPAGHSHFVAKKLPICSAGTILTGKGLIFLL